MSERDTQFNSPPRQRRRVELPPSARSTGTAGTRYSAAAPVNLNFKLTPSRAGEPPPSYTNKYAAPETLIYGGFQPKSLEKKTMEDAQNKLAMLLFDTEFQKKLKEGNAEAKELVENLERLKRGEFKNGNFPKPLIQPLPLSIPEGGAAIQAQPPALAPLRIKRLRGNENNLPKNNKKSRKRKQSRKLKGKSLKNRRHK